RGKVELTQGRQLTIMVTHKTTPDFSLEAVHRLARFKQVEFASSRVHNQLDGLGYSVEDVCDCLQALEEKHFSKSITYDAGGWMDVYLRQWPAPNRNPPLLGRSLYKTQAEWKMHQHRYPFVSL